MAIRKVGESFDVVPDGDRRELFGVEGSDFRDLLNGSVTSTIIGDNVFDKVGNGIDELITGQNGDSLLAFVDGGFEVVGNRDFDGRKDLSGHFEG